MIGEKLNRFSVCERVRGGKMIWAAWAYGDALQPLAKLYGVQDRLEYTGIEFESLDLLIAYHCWVESDDDSDESADYWGSISTWHDFDSWEESEEWFER